MKYDFVVIGAGIVGLAAAFKIHSKRPFSKIAIVEKESSVAAHQTGRNSGVLHSGLYYQPGSLKAQMCLKGYSEIVEFAESHGIPYRLCGKLVVANGPEQEARLMELAKRGEQNGLKGLSFLSPEEAREREPYVSCSQALWVPQTGVIDFKLVAKSLEKELQLSGVDFFFDQAVKSLVPDRAGVSV
ncbi:MAG: FAD-dependent oxidoreductase, partial [Pseudomonadota bacterium]